LIDTRIANSGGVIINMGDLKWLVEQAGEFEWRQVWVRVPPCSSCFGGGACGGRGDGEAIGRFGEGSGRGRLWLIGTATCETYLRCQVYHPTMENDGIFMQWQLLLKRLRQCFQGIFGVLLLI
jgi:hypothetical protein